MHTDMWGTVVTYPTVTPIPPQLQQYHRKPILTVVVGKRPEVLQCEPLPGFVEVHVAVVYCQQLVRLVK